MTQQTEVAPEAAATAEAVERPPSAEDVLARLGDIEVQATVELGRAELLVRDLARVGPGHVVELDRLVGEPAELKVNGRLFAKGEVVVLEDQLGFRVTQLAGGGEDGGG